MSASSKKKLRKEQNAAKLTERQRSEQKEAKKLKITSTIFVVVMSIILLTAVVLLAVTGIRNTGLIEKNTIALTVGEHKVNSVEMSYFFTDYVNTQYDEWSKMYGDYTDLFLSSMGLDTTKPLNEQSYNGTDSTWADSFLDGAVHQAADTYAMYDQAIAAGYTVNDESQSSIDSQINILQLYASMNGVSFENYIVMVYGNGANENSLRDYLEVTAIASQYYNDHLENLSYDDAAIRAYEADKVNHYNSYSYNSYYVSCNNFLGDITSTDATDAQMDAAVAEAKTVAESLLTATDAASLDAAIAALEINKENATAASTVYTDTLYTNMMEIMQEWMSDTARKAGDITVIPYEGTDINDNDEEVTRVMGYYVVLFGSSKDNNEPQANVRHLLVKFEEDESGNVIEDSKAAAKAEAEGYLAEWNAGAKTEDSFIELVKAHSQDTSATTGGLFEDINPASSYVTNFLNWSINPDRVAGDAEVIETEYGYHVMYYVGDDELTYRDSMIINEMTTADMESWYNGIVSAATHTEGDLSKIDTALVLSAG